MQASVAIFTFSINIHSDFDELFDNFNRFVHTSFVQGCAAFLIMEIKFSGEVKFGHLLDDTDVIATSSSKNIHLIGFQVEPLFALGHIKFKFDELLVVLKLVQLH